MKYLKLWITLTLLYSLLSSGCREHDINPQGELYVGINFLCDSLPHLPKLHTGLENQTLQINLPYRSNGRIEAPASIQANENYPLTAVLEQHFFDNGKGNLIYDIEGVPTKNAAVTFDIVKNNESCRLIISVTDELISRYSPESQFCSGNITEITEVQGSYFFTRWMSQNLEASQTAENPRDQKAYGGLYQWGRVSDLHQCNNSRTTTSLSATARPNHSDFILAQTVRGNWLNDNDTTLWEGIQAPNNPCPNGFRLPTAEEFETEVNSWGQQDFEGAFNSRLKLPLSGYRDALTGDIKEQGLTGYYWTSSTLDDRALCLKIGINTAQIIPLPRTTGACVRCIKN